MDPHRPASHTGPLRRLLAAIAARLQITAADLPQRAPVDAGHWEGAPAVTRATAALRDVPLPRGTAVARPASPAVLAPTAAARH